jgi:hypothetical protein
MAKIARLSGCIEWIDLEFVESRRTTEINSSKPRFARWLRHAARFGSVRRVDTCSACVVTLTERIATFSPTHRLQLAAAA